MKNSAKHAVELMNDFGRKGCPFLFMFDFELERPLVLPLNEVDANQILYEIEGRGNASRQMSDSLQPIVFEKYPPPFEEYKIIFDAVMAHLKQGDSCLVNLTQPVSISTNLSLNEMFFRSQARFKLLYKDEVLVFSPEPFIRIEKDEIHTFPMKGTLDAALPNAEDTLLNDFKELAEHRSAVELLTRDLKKVANNVKTQRFRYVETIETLGGSLLQTSSHISGKLRPAYASQLGSLLLALLPAGSISGMPKAKSLRIIRQYEGYKRGYYTGVFGVFDGQILESGVMIRFIEKTPKGLVFKAGGGITQNSTAEKEYNEMIRKVALPFR